MVVVVVVVVVGCVGKTWVRGRGEKGAREVCRVVARLVG